MSLAFRDQYEANNALIRSQREMLALVQTLLERIDTLEARLEDRTRHHKSPTHRRPLQR